jgi:hypothetical protein
LTTLIVLYRANFHKGPLARKGAGTGEDDMRVLRRAACALMGATLALTATSAWAADKIKISLAATDDAIYLPFFVALDKGFYK